MIRLQQRRYIAERILRVPVFSCEDAGNKSGMLAVFCTYGLGLIPQAVQRISYGYVYMDVAIALF